MNEQNEREVPLTELLASVPKDARYEHSPRAFYSSYFPIGQYCHDALAEINRLKQFEEAYIQWITKTEWIQGTFKPIELGRHRADVIKTRMDDLERKNNDLEHENFSLKTKFENQLADIEARLKKRESLLEDMLRAILLCQAKVQLPDAVDDKMLFSMLQDVVEKYYKDL